MGLIDNFFKGGNNGNGNENGNETPPDPTKGGYRRKKSRKSRKSRKFRQFNGGSNNNKTETVEDEKETDEKETKQQGGNHTWNTGHASNFQGGRRRRRRKSRGGRPEFGSNAELVPEGSAGFNLSVVQPGQSNPATEYNPIAQIGGSRRRSRRRRRSSRRRRSRNTY